MRPLRALAIYIAVVFLGGALLAPWVYWIGRNIPALAEVPFHRFVSRSLTVVALVGLWPLFRGLGAKTASDLGLVRPTRQWKKLFAGFLVGFISLALVATIALVGGGRILHDRLTLGRIAEKLLGAALTATTVSMLEEILFRGGIHGGLRRVFNWRVALIVSSMIYAIVHFFARTQDPAHVTWLSGFGQLGLMLQGFTNWQQIVPGFFNLTIAGVLLALAYQRTGNLYFSIGLHAGWIFWLASYRTLTSEAAGANVWFWGSSHMIDGWLAFVILCLTLAGFTWWRPRESRHLTA